MKLTHLDPWPTFAGVATSPDVTTSPDVAASPGVAARPVERFLVTGALGCIGAWTVRLLVEEGVPVVAYDRATEPRRLRLVMSPEQLARITFVAGDITDLAALERTLEVHAISHVIHLAALQVPFARADPPAGAMVNVVGTVNVFEAVKRHAARGHGPVAPIVFAGSIGMFDAADADASDGLLRADASAHPGNHYGVYKLANEGTARVYWQDDGIASVSLRPFTVYGPGRDQGLTSDPTRATLAAVTGRPFRIGFGGSTLLQYAPDAARAFIAAARAGLDGARAINLPGTFASMDEVEATIEAAVPEARGLVSHESRGLPFPSRIDTSGVEALGELPVTPLRDAVSQTVALFRDRISAGWLVPEEHGLPPEARPEARPEAPPESRPEPRP